MPTQDPDNIEESLAIRLKQLRIAQGLTLDELAKSSGISKATLSRIEKFQVSPTTHVLGKLCAAFGLTLSRLMMMVESNSPALIPRHNQVQWTDLKTGFVRRCVSPPDKDLSCEVLECELSPGTFIEYADPPIVGLEHHLVLHSGVLQVAIEDNTYTLHPGDCLRYKLQGSSAFKVLSDQIARYLLVIA